MGSDGTASSVSLPHPWSWDEVSGNLSWWKGNLLDSLVRSLVGMGRRMGPETSTRHHGILSAESQTLFAPQAAFPLYSSVAGAATAPLWGLWVITHLPRETSWDPVGCQPAVSDRLGHHSMP